MANDIFKVTFPNGQTYTLKDATARQQIADLAAVHTSAIHYRGVTSTALTDGVTTNPIIIDNTNFTAQSGDIVIVGSSGTNANAPREFIFNGTKWNEFGSTGSLKALAFKDQVTAGYTPQGTITGSFSGAPTTIESSYTPSGVVSQPSFDGTTATISVTGQIINATVSIPYTPGGIVSTPSFTGTQHTLTVCPVAGTASYTPSGSISTPTITVMVNTASVKGFSTVGTLPSFTMTVSDQVLSFSFDEGALPTYETKTFATNIQSATSSEPIFTGTGVRLSTDYTPSGANSQPSFTGTAVTLAAVVTAPTQTATGSYTPAGVVSTPAFTGTGGTACGNYTPQGSVTGLTFRGTSTTITSS